MVCLASCGVYSFGFCNFFGHNENVVYVLKEEGVIHTSHVEYEAQLSTLYKYELLT